MNVSNYNYNQLVVTLIVIMIYLAGFISFQVNLHQAVNYVLTPVCSSLPVICIEMLPSAVELLRLQVKQE